MPGDEGLDVGGGGLLDDVGLSTGDSDFSLSWLFLDAFSFIFLKKSIDD